MSSSSNISAGSRRAITRQLDKWLNNFGASFGKDWDGDAFLDDFNGLLLSAELHKELARCALAFAAKHGLEPGTLQEDVDKAVDECVEMGAREAAVPFDMAAFDANSSRWQDFQQFVWEEMKAADPATPFHTAVDAAIPRFHLNQPVAEADRAAFSEWLSARAAAPAAAPAAAEAAAAAEAEAEDDEDDEDPMWRYAAKVTAILPDLLQEPATICTIAELLCGYKHNEDYHSADVYISPLAALLAQAEGALKEAEE